MIEVRPVGGLINMTTAQATLLCEMFREWEIKASDETYNGFKKKQEEKVMWHVITNLAPRLLKAIQ